MNWDSEIKNLKKLVFEDKMSYIKIGKLYGCSDSNIRKVMQKRGIQLPIRSKNAGNTPVNKGTGKKYYCLNCGKDISFSYSSYHKYCSNSCQQEFEYNKWVNKYKQNNSIAKSTKWGQIPGYLKRYIFNKYENKCCKCGWSKINPYTQTLPLEIDHINGNYKDNSEDNLQLICPNCLSLTPTYRGANRGNGRDITWSIKNKDKSAQEEILDAESP